MLISPGSARTHLNVVQVGPAQLPHQPRVVVVVVVVVVLVAVLRDAVSALEKATVSAERSHLQQQQQQQQQ